MKSCDEIMLTAIHHLSCYISYLIRRSCILCILYIYKVYIYKYIALYNRLFFNKYKVIDMKIYSI